MDNTKTGALIRQLRREKGMTQKELAQRLHITDQAVSKWERGLCAPDIALLEPLAEALDSSVLELIEGERKAPPSRDEAQEKGAETVLRYSKKEIARKLRTVRKRYLCLTAVCAAALMALCGALLWRGGYLFLVDRSQSPDGSLDAAVYSKALSGGGFSMRDGTSLIVRQKDGQGSWRVTYGDCTYQGLWWAPDSKKYVLALGYGEETRLALARLDDNSESNLSAYLSFGVETTELRRYGYAGESGGFPDIRYQFLQWGLDSASMLIYYAFQDSEGAMHEGYFWYNCEDGTVRAVLELNRQGTKEVPPKKAGPPLLMWIDSVSQ